MINLSLLLKEDSGILDNLQSLKGRASGAHILAAELGDRADPCSRNVACGRGFSHSEALLGVIAEGVERYCAHKVPPGSLLYESETRMGEMVVGLGEFGLYRRDQLDFLGMYPYLKDTPMTWCKAINAVDGATVSVPASLVYLSPQVAVGGRLYVPLNSTGLATAATREGANAAGLLEVLEREAIVRAWRKRLPLPTLRIDSDLDARALELVAEWHEQGLSVEFYSLPTGGTWWCVGVLVANDRDAELLPQAVTGFAAGFSAVEAATRALLEAAQMDAIVARWLEMDEMVDRLRALTANPSSVRSPQDHGLLYAGPRGLDEKHWGHMRGRSLRAEVSATETSLLEVQLELARRGSSIYFCDISDPITTSAGFVTTRTLVTRSQAVHFGWGAARVDPHDESAFYNASTSDLHPLA